MDVDRQRLLLQKASVGDRVAIEELLLAHYDRLRTHIEFQMPASVKAVASTDDILHETCRKAFVAIRGFQAERPESLFAWLRMIADNTVRDLLRCMKYEERSVRPAPPTPDDIRGSAFLPSYEPSAASDTPMERAQREELVRTFHSALASLPDDYRQAVRLCYIEGLSLSEAAERMNRTPDSVRSLCFRAKKQLQSTINRLSLYI